MLDCSLARHLCTRHDAIPPVVGELGARGQNALLAFDLSVQHHFVEGNKLAARGDRAHDSGLPPVSVRVRARGDNAGPVLPGVRARMLR